jgi:hypothetical protein
VKRGDLRFSAAVAEMVKTAIGFVAQPLAVQGKMARRSASTRGESALAVARRKC